MSQATAKAMRSYLDDARKTHTKLRVLTWDHKVDSQTVEAFRKHLDESRHEPGRVQQQLLQAWLDWRALERDYSDILTVREYGSSPTLQGVIVGKEWALIELLPYATHPEDRPALLLKPKTDPDLFDLVKEQYEKLWHDSE